MFNLFYLHTTQMKFLEVLINNRDRDFADTMDAIHQKFPRMTQYEINSYLDELRKNGYIKHLMATTEYVIFWYSQLPWPTCEKTMSCEKMTGCGML